MAKVYINREQLIALVRKRGALRLRFNKDWFGEHRWRYIFPDGTIRWSEGYYAWTDFVYSDHVRRACHNRYVTLGKKDSLEQAIDAMLDYCKRHALPMRADVIEVIATGERL